MNPNNKPAAVMVALSLALEASGQSVFNGTADSLSLTVNTTDGSAYALVMPSGMRYSFPSPISGLSATDTNLEINGSITNSGTAGVAICLSQSGQLTIYQDHTMATDITWFLWGFFTCVLLAMAGATRRLLARAFDVPPEL